MPTDDQRKREVEEQRLRQRAKIAARAAARISPSRWQGTPGRRPARRAGKLLGVERGECQRREGRDIAERYENDARDREDEHGPDRHQGIDCPGGDPVDRQDRCDIHRHAVGRPFCSIPLVPAVRRPWPAWTPRFAHPGYDCFAIISRVHVPDRTARSPRTVVQRTITSARSSTP